MGLISFLKKMPIDLGQGNINTNLRTKTYGKVIAESLVPPVKIEEIKKALDVGCREGFQSEWLEKKGYDVTSIDVEKKFEKCIIMDANKELIFKDNSFDLIWCSEVIEHLDNPIKAIEEFKRLLKPEGKFIITTPNSYFWLYNIAKIFGKTAKDLQNPGHKQFFSEKNIKNICQDSKIYGYFPYMIKKFKIKKNINFLSPTFVVEYYKK